jgi:hypothetical protein
LPTTSTRSRSTSPDTITVGKSGYLIGLPVVIGSWAVDEL